MDRIADQVVAWIDGEYGLYAIVSHDDGRHCLFSTSRTGNHCLLCSVTPEVAQAAYKDLLTAPGQPQPSGEGMPEDYERQCRIAELVIACRSRCRHPK